LETPANGRHFIFSRGLFVKKLLIAAILFAFIAEVQAKSEPRFNALEPSDPAYPEYQEALCDAALKNAIRFGRERYEMDVWMSHGYPIMPVRSEQDRQDYIETWVVTTELRDQAQKALDENCN
jgi:hypothetical protein